MRRELLRKHYLLEDTGGQDPLGSMGILIREVNRKNQFEPTCYEDLVNQSRKNPINRAIFDLSTGFFGGRGKRESYLNLQPVSK
jgi:hypothetical protein